MQNSKISFLVRGKTNPSSISTNWRENGLKEIEITQFFNQ